jgi:hypothetical protein
LIVWAVAANSFVKQALKKSLLVIAFERGLGVVESLRNGIRQ